MEPEARASTKLTRAAPGFASARHRRSMRHLPAPERVDALLDYLVYGSGPGSELGAVLDVAEELLAGKDMRSANLVTAVLLEKLQLLVSYPDNALTVEETELLLGPQSLAAWREIDELWLAVGDDLDGRPTNISVSDYLKLSSAELRREFRGTYRVLPPGPLVGVFDILRWETGYRYAETAASQSDQQSRADPAEATQGVA
jgi:hypothetical protein